MNTTSSRGGSIAVHLRAAIVGLGTGLSRILGLVREMLTSYIFGATGLQSAFYIAFQIPNLFRKLFGEGALSSAFIPAFTDSLNTEEKEESRRFACRILTLLALVLGVITVLVALVSLIVQHGGLSPDTNWNIAHPLLRIMIPYMPLICMAAIMGGVLNTLGDYKSWAFAPCILNLVWIGVLLSFFGIKGLTSLQQIRIVSVFVLFAGFLQFAFLWAVLRRKGWSLTPDLHFRGDPRVRHVCIVMLPTALAGAVFQINQLLDNVIANELAAEWAPACLGYADRIVYLPLGLVATSYCTALLPTLSAMQCDNQSDEIRDALSSAFRGILVLMMPAAIGIVALCDPITALFYQHGAFDPQSTTRVAHALAGYAIGLPFIGLQKAVTQFYYARKDVRTPMVIALSCVALNLTLNLVFVLTWTPEWKHVGIAVSTTLSAVTGLVLLLARVRPTSGMQIDIAKLVRTAVVCLIAALVMGLAAHYAFRFASGMLEPHLATFKGRTLCALGISMIAAMMVYGIVLLVFGRDLLAPILRIANRVLRRVGVRR